MAKPTATQHLYKLQVSTDPQFLEIAEVGPAVRAIIMHDSLFDHFPVGQLTLNDDSGTLAEDFLFTEGLKFKFRVTPLWDDAQYIQHNFFWSEHQNRPGDNQFNIGPQKFILLSDFRLQDAIKSKSYNGNISDIVRQIMTQYQYPGQAPVLNISPTANFDKWYQGEISDAEFIDILASYAYSPSEANSPFFTFINLRGEFNFVTAEKMLSANVDPDLKLTSTATAAKNNPVDRAVFVTDPNRIVNFKFAFIGAPGNMVNWKRKFFSLESTGSTKSESISLDSKIKLVGNNARFPIRKQTLTDIRETLNFGVVGPKQQNMLKGWINHQMINTLSFPFRLEITTGFNPKLVAGATCNVELQSYSKDRNYISEEYSGNWVVLESTHLATKKGVANSAAVLGRNSLNIRNTHKFYPEFIS